MLAYLDTIIGFAVVMLAISLLITILIQMISALLSHRGSNLRWGLETLFAKMAPTVYPDLARNARSVAEHVLTHPLVSDSLFSKSPLCKWPLIGPLVERFQLASAIRPEELVGILEHLASG